MKKNTLAEIRAKFSAKVHSQPTEQQPTKPCPKCEKPLTIERKRYFETEVCEHCLDHAQVNHIDTCCDLVSLHHVKLVTSAGTIQVREQCQNCGEVKANSLGGFTKEQREKLPLVDEAKRKERQDSWYQMVRAFNDGVSEKRQKVNTLRKQQWMRQYDAYLNSPAWKEKRLLVLKRDQYLCQCCLDAYATQVHHKNYQFVDLKGSEPAFDLVAICVPCHDKIEAMKAEARKM